MHRDHNIDDVRFRDIESNKKSHMFIPFSLAGKLHLLWSLMCLKSVDLQPRSGGAVKISLDLNSTQAALKVILRALGTTKATKFNPTTSRRHPQQRLNLKTLTPTIVLNSAIVHATHPEIRTHIHFPEN